MARNPVFSSRHNFKQKNESIAVAFIPLMVAVFDRSTRMNHCC